MEKPQITTIQPLIKPQVDQENIIVQSDVIQPERTQCYQLSVSFTNLWNYDERSRTYKILCSGITLVIVGILAAAIWYACMIGFLVMVMSVGRGIC